MYFSVAKRASKKKKQKYFIYSIRRKSGLLFKFSVGVNISSLLLIRRAHVVGSSFYA